MSVLSVGIACAGSTGCAVLALIVATMCAGLVAAQTDGSPSGPIDRLTPETREMALSCGRTGPDCAIRPYQLCEHLNTSYTIQLITPFSRVASAALDAQQTGKPLGRIGPATVNQWGIGLEVGPAERSESAAAIQSVEVHKAQQKIQPIRTIVGPITTLAADGSIRQLSRGFFVFSASAFESSSDTTVVFVGSTSEHSCTIGRAKLQNLR